MFPMDADGLNDVRRHVPCVEGRGTVTGVADDFDCAEH